MVASCCPSASSGASVRIATSASNPSATTASRPTRVPRGISVTPAVREFLSWLGSRTLLGYYLDFDVSMLAPHVKSITGFALPNARIDLADAFAARERQARPDVPPDLGFQRIAEELGVPILGRHTALGDATTTALCWLALQARQRGG